MPEVKQNLQVLIDELKKAAIDYKRWQDNGFTVSDETDESDIYPSDLFEAVATPTNILELLAELGDLCRHVQDRNREIAHLRETLLLIGTDCENYIAPHSCWTEGHTPDALYGADSVCPHCLANRALYTSPIVISGLNTNQQKPLTPSEFWDAAPWNYDMDNRPKNQRSLIKNDAGNITTACCSICERDIAWLPLPEQK